MIAATDRAKPELGTLTGPQSVSLNYGDGALNRSTASYGTYAEYRTLSKDPTIALGTGLLVSGILAGTWSVEADEDVNEDIVDSISSILLPLRESIMRTSIRYGRIDFGWQGFEKIFTIKDGRLVIERLKPLLQDITTILVDVHGNFVGYKQDAVTILHSITIPLEKCLLINFGVECTQLYGYPLLENIRATQTMWDECNDGARRYDKKIAGSHFVIKYPPGSSQIDGETVDNGEVAAQLLAALESSGSLALPTTVADLLQEITNDSVGDLYAWHVDLLSDTSPRQATFIERAKYLDALKIRGLILPERSMLEGQFGTKAEAGEHIGLAITNMQCIDQTITQMINDQVVNQLLALNWGEAMIGKVKLVAAPLVNKDLEFLRKVYLAITGKQIDIVALQEQLSIPFGQKEEVINANLPTDT